MDPKKVGWKSMDWINLAQGRANRGLLILGFDQMRGIYRVIRAC
jgi:hypothetical protein